MWLAPDKLWGVITARAAFYNICKAGRIPDHLGGSYGDGDKDEDDNEESHVLPGGPRVSFLTELSLQI